MADVVIDFTTPAASADLARFCANRGGPALVIGSTGFDAAELATIADAAKTIPIVRSGSFSLGLNMLVGLVEQAARALDPDDWDAEIFEAHHRHKVDAPSGTALMLGAGRCRRTRRRLDTVARRVRDGVTGARPAGEIGFAVMRGGSIIGEHSVSFCAEGETRHLVACGRRPHHVRPWRHRRGTLGGGTAARRIRYARRAWLDVEQGDGLSRHADGDAGRSLPIRKV